ncbi:hypothetical protein PSTEL_19905 [Paenibacillus stellifer]|uniref:ABC3 transporter permease protein domain-containing protein n=1 Tax=Paenibacillus stellifer TaxID=169760 RepID=A0A089N8D0_9BACL|nr:hypothetical protein PSTEL_19905 [Paenibacillus stellifer]
MAINALVKMTEANRNILYIFSGITGTITITLFLWSINASIKKNFDIYKVLLISGASMSQLSKVTRNQFMVCFGLSSLIPLVLIFSLINNSSNIIIIYFLVILIIFVLFTYIIHYFTRHIFKRLDIIQHLKG